MTEQNEEWGPWIEHDGKCCPVPFGTWVRVQGDYPPNPKFFYDDEGMAGSGSGLAWDWTNVGKQLPNGKKCGRIIRYRIRKPRALSQLQEMIRNLPEGIDA